MTDLSLAIAGLPEREQILILRAACHVADEPLLPVQAQFCNRVTELDAARLIHAIERGAMVIQRGTAWADLEGALRARMPHLTRVVLECTRLGLVRQATTQLWPDVWRTWLVAAPVHEQAGLNRTRCTASFQRPYGRFRLSDERALIDCAACLSVTDA